MRQEREGLKYNTNEKKKITAGKYANLRALVQRKVKKFNQQRGLSKKGRRVFLAQMSRSSSEASILQVISKVPQYRATSGDNSLCGCSEEQEVMEGNATSSGGEKKLFQITIRSREIRVCLVSCRAASSSPEMLSYLEMLLDADWDAALIGWLRTRLFWKLPAKKFLKFRN